jgi:protein-S-isoprenylcysteine O-methyltransferase Ste14
VLSTAGLTSVFLAFAAANLSQWRVVGHPVGMGLVAQGAVAAALFIVRRRPLGTTRSFFAWLITGLAVLTPMFARPHYQPVADLGWLYSAIQLTGLAGALISLLCLGRSFGLVPANRGIKVGGAYRLVRHPVYACYLISDAGYLLENPTLWNAAILSIVLFIQILRIREEERFLATDAEYRLYRAQVRYRLIPLIF